VARRLSTVSDLVSEVREQIDEQNVDSVGTETRILPTLNRGLEYAFDLMARRYPDPFIRYGTVTLVSGTQEYDIPEDCFEDRIQRVEVEISGSFEEVRRVSYYDAWKFESPSPTSIPVYYCVVGRKMRLLPAPTGTYSLRIWYVREPEQLVLPQGRITSINLVSNYVLVDQIGNDISTESDTLESYVNIVDSQTGIVKWTGQVQNIEDTQIVFRAAPIRTDVMNRDVSGTLPAASANPHVSLDDFVCSARGVCIPPGSPLRNFLVQYAAAEIVRSLGGDAATEEQLLQKFERQLATSTSGRENTTRIQRRSSAWGRTRRKWFVNQQ